MLKQIKSCEHAVGKSALQNAEKSQYRVRKNRSTECGKVASNKTDINKTYFIQSDSIKERVKNSRAKKFFTRNEQCFLNFICCYILYF